MRAPEPIREHPNATFVFTTAPLSALFCWLIALRWTSMPTEVAAALGTLLSSVCLVFASSIKRGVRNVAHQVWELGVLGVCRRIWRGKTS